MRGAKYVRDVINDRLSVYSTVSSVSLSGIKPLKRKYGDPLEEIEATSDTNSTQSILDCVPLETDGKGNIIDPQLGRKITLKGINMDAGLKLPLNPDMPTYKADSTNPDDVFFDGDHVSFVGRPYPLEEAELHFRRIKSWGYNTIRYIITWEAIEHEGPGKYDDDYIDYTAKILDIIYKIGGLYVFIDPHQDVWSRFSGGSGAPLWTLYAAGLQPKRFAHTEASILHNEPRFQDPAHPEYEPFPKMIWPSNYKRLASLTMFTLFWAGATYFPDLTINNVNIQHYLQDHYIDSQAYFWSKITERLPHMIENGSLLGFESMNEPNCGLVGHEHLGYLPTNQQLRIGTTPTVYQCMKLGMGFAVEISVYKITMSGPQKAGTKIVDPKGARAWLSPEEAQEIDCHYGWKRGSNWKIGNCIFSQRRIWKWDKNLDLSILPNLSAQERLKWGNENCELKLPNYFNQVSSSLKFNLDILPKKINMEFFTNNFFVDYYIKFKKMVREITPNIFVMIQPPVLEIPPDLRKDTRHIIDSKTIYCPHYYDGVSLLFKTWNTKYNVDTMGIMRGCYFNPVLGIVFGERAIRNCLKRQFQQIKQECEDYLGSIPTLMSETGMPFDMDDKRSYDDCKYISQTGAIDALSYALEGSNMSHTYWCYTSINSHKFGDRWNNEDFSFWSPEDRNLLLNDDPSPEIFNQNFNMSSTSTSMSRLSSLKSKAVLSIKTGGETLKVKTRKYSSNGRGRLKRIGTKHQRRRSAAMIENKSINEPNGSETLNGEASNNSSSERESDDNTDSQSTLSVGLISTTSENVRLGHNRKCYPSPDGVRAASAVIRPYAVATRGSIRVSEFDIKSVKFALTVSFANSNDEDSDRDTPTIIYLPKWHYPYLNYGDIYLTSGTVKYNSLLEYLEWYHNEDGSETDENLSSTSATNTEETIIIKNNSGSLDDLKVPGGCPIS